MALKPVVIANPHPLIGDGRTFSYETFLKGETLGDYLVRTGVDVGRGPKSVYVNGERVPDDKWHLLLPETGDQIVIRTRATGGNGGKVLRVVAMVALTIATYGVGGWAGLGASLSSATGIGLGASQAILMIGGSILIGALLPPMKPSTMGTKEKEQSPTYGISAGKNNYNSYGPMIVVFGQHKVVPYFASKPYTTFQGNDQYLSQAFHFGLQPDLDLQAIRIGTTDISNYRDVEVNRSTYDGKLSLVAGNVDTLDGFELSKEDGWTARRTPRDTEHISVDVAANLYQISDEGDEETVTVQIEAQYKAVDSAEWTPLAGYYETRASHYWSLGRWTTEDSPFGGKQVWQQVQYGSINPEEHTANEPVEICHDRFVPMKGKVRMCETYFWRWIPYGITPWQGRAPDPVTGFTGTGVTDLKGSDSQKPARTTLEVGVAAGEYDVRFRKLTDDLASTRASNKLTVAQIRCTQTDNADYSGQCRMAVRIKATSQLNGAIDSLSSIARAKTLIWQNNAWVEAYTSNPAWWYLFWARGMRDEEYNRVYGECLPDEKIDLEAIKSWAAWCDEKGLRFNWVLDRKMSIEEVYYVIARAGRASKTMNGGKLSVIWDSADIPVSNFATPENIIAGSFQYTYINTEVADEIIINFFNEEKDYEPDVVRQKVPGAVEANNPITMDLEGCTVAGQAGREANLLAASQYFHRKQFSWEMDVEGATFTRGDVIQLTHDLTSWGASGRFLSYQNGRITLDSYVEKKENAWMSIRSPNNKIVNVRVSHVADTDGDQVYIVGGWPKDEDDNDLIPQPNGNEIDYIWQYSPSETPGRKVQIKSVKPAARGNVKFEAIEYSREYHESEDNPFIHVPTGTGTKALINVFGITASERIIDEVTGRVEVTLTWVLSEKSESDVHLYVNGEPFDSFVTPRYMTSLTAVQGDIIDIEVNPTKEGRGVSERYQYTVNGTLFQIPAIRSLTTASEVYGIRLNWTIPAVNYIQRTEIWYSEQSTRGTAQKLTDLAYPQQEYRHAGVRAGQEYYYWVRLVDRFGNIGPFYPVDAGVRGVSSTNVADYIEIFKDEFLDSEVGKNLQDEIDIITGDSSVPGSIAHEVKQAQDTINDTIDAARSELEGQISTVSDSVTEARSELEQTNQALNTAKDELNDSINLVDDRITNVNDGIQSQLAGINTAVSAAQGDVSDLLDRMTDAESGLELSNEMIEDLDGTLTGFTQQMNQAIADTAQAILANKDDIAAEIQNRQASDSGILTTVNDHIENVYGPFAADVEQKIQTFTDFDIAIATRADQIEARTNVGANLLSNSGLDNNAEGWLTVDIVNGALVFNTLEDSNSYQLVGGTKWGSYVAERNVNTQGLLSPTLDLSWSDLVNQSYVFSADLDFDIAANIASLGSIAAVVFLIDPSSGFIQPVKQGNGTAPKTLSGFSETDSQRYSTAYVLTPENLLTEAEFNNIRSANPNAKLRLAVTTSSRPSGKLFGFRRFKLEVGSQPTAYTNEATTTELHARVIREEASRVTGDEALAQRSEAIEVNAGRLEGLIQDLDEAVVTEQNARATSIQTLTARVNVKPNLLPNGGFERGMEGWLGSWWDVVDDPYYGRHLKLKAQYLTSTGSQTTTQYVNGIKPGQTITLTFDGYVVADAGTVGANIEFWSDTASLLSITQKAYNASIPEFSIDDSRRYERKVTGTAPAGTTRARVRFYKLGTGTNLTAMGIRRMKLEAGDTATPYTAELEPILLGASIANQQQAITDLQSGKAEASDMTQIKSRMGAAESSITSANSAISDLDAKKATVQSLDAMKAQYTGGSNSGDLNDVTNGLFGQVKTAIATTESALVEMVTSLSASANTQFNPWRIWGFYSGNEGWSAVGGSLTTTSIGIKLTASSANNGVMSPAGLNFDGKENYFIRCRVRRLGGTGWEGGAYFANDVHSVATTYRKLIDEPDWSQGWVELMWDMSELTYGGDDWLVGGPIKLIRLDLGAASTDIFEFDWIAVGNPSPGASQAQLKNIETAAATATSAVAETVSELETKVDGNDSAIKARVNATENALSSSVTGSVANRLQTLETEYGTNIAQVKQDITSVTNDLSATTQVANSAASRSEENEASISRIESTFTDETNALANRADILEARTGVNPNLLPNGGFEDGLAGWENSGFFEIVDSEEFGRYAKLKDQYLTASGSQVVFQRIPVVPGQKLTYSIECFVKYLGSPNTGSIGASLQFFNASNVQVGNFGINTDGITDVFKPERRYEQVAKATVPADAATLRVRFYKIGNGTNIHSMGVRRLKVELGDVATPYTADASVVNAYAQIKATQTTVTNLESSFAQDLNSVNASLGNRISTVEGSVTALSNDAVTQAQRTTTLESKINFNPNLLPNGGFELDLEGWTANSAYFEVRTDPVYGKYAAYKKDYLDNYGTGSFISPKVPAKAGQAYTLTADAFAADATAGSLILYLRFLNSAGTAIATRSMTLAAGTIDTFSPDDSRRYDTKITALSPAGTEAINVYLQKTGTLSASAAGWRRVKLEAGLVATPYTAEATTEFANASINQKATTLSSDIQAVAGTVSALRTDFNNNTASVSGQITAMSNEIEAVAGDVSSLETAVDDNATAITAERNARTTQYNSIAQDVQSLTAVAGRKTTFRQTTQPTAAQSKEGDRWINTSSGKNNEEKYYTGSSWVDISDPRAKTNSENIATLQTDQTALATNVSALATRTTNLESSVNTGANSLSKLRASINSTAETLADADQAIGRRIDGVITTVGDNAAEVNQKISALTNADTAFAERADTLEARMGGNPNLLKNGGFERGLEGWSGNLFDVIDDPVYGRYASLKSQYLNASGSQVSASDSIQNIVPGTFYTLSADYFNRYTSSTRGGYFAMSMQFLDADGATLTNHQAPGAYVNTQFDPQRRFNTTYVTAQAPAGAARVRARVYKIQNGQNVEAMGVRQVKLESGQVVTPYSTEGALNYANARSDEKISAVATDVNAVAQSVSGLTSEFNSNKSSVSQSLATLASADESMANQLTNVRSSVDDNAAAIDSAVATWSDQYSSLAQSVQTVQASVSDVQNTADAAVASAETNAEAIADTEGKLSSTITTKVQILANGQRVFAGTGLGIEYDPNGDGFQSSYNVWADRFAVWSGSGTELFSPFVVSNGQVFINDAVIGKLSADKITGGTYNVGGSNGYGCIRTTGKAWGDGKPGFFIQTLENGDAAFEMVAGNSRIYMDSGWESGINFGNGAFQVYSTGYMEINALNVIKRANIAGGSVVGANTWRVTSGRYNGHYYWAANLGNTEPVNIAVMYYFSSGINAGNFGFRMFDMKVGGNRVFDKRLTNNIAVDGNNYPLPAYIDNGVYDPDEPHVVKTMWVPANAVVEFSSPQNDDDDMGGLILDITIFSFFR